MRSYFWMREGRRGNVYAQSQIGGLSEATLLNRNDSVSAENPCVEILCGDYPKKRYILKEFCSPATFQSERDAFVCEMTRGGSIPLEPSLREALSLASVAVCQNDSNAAILTSARMLNKTLMHLRSKPPIESDCVGRYDAVSGQLLVSNGNPANCHCNVLIYYHPYAWDYYVKSKPKEHLTAYPTHRWGGVCNQTYTGNVRWDVATSLSGHRFVDFASFENPTCGTGYPSVFVGTQYRRRNDGCGVLTYWGMHKVAVTVQDYQLNRTGVACSCGETVFVAATGATCLEQQRHSPYSCVLTEWEGRGGIPVKLYRAYTAVRYNGELGTCNLFYRDYNRERDLGTFSPSAMLQWLRTNLTCSIASEVAGCYIPFYCAVVEDAGRKIGEYRASGEADAAFCGKPVGAILRMRKCYDNPIFSAELQSNLEATGNVGDFVEGSGVPVLGFLPSEWSPESVVTFQTREAVTAKVDFRGFCLGVWQADAKVIFVLGVNNSWQDFPSNELLAAFNEVANIELPVYAETSIPISWEIPRYGITGVANFGGGVEPFTLGQIANLLGYSVVEMNIGEIYEKLTAGIEMVFHANPYGSTGLVTSKIGIHQDFRDEPCADDDWTRR